MSSKSSEEDIPTGATQCGDRQTSRAAGTPKRVRPVKQASFPPNDHQRTAEDGGRPPEDGEDTEDSEDTAKKTKTT